MWRKHHLHEVSCLTAVNEQMSVVSQYKRDFILFTSCQFYIFKMYPTALVAAATTTSFSSQALSFTLSPSSPSSVYPSSASSSLVSQVERSLFSLLGPKIALKCPTYFFLLFLFSEHAFFPSSALPPLVLLPSCSTPPHQTYVKDKRVRLSPSLSLSPDPSLCLVCGGSLFYIYIYISAVPLCRLVTRTA